VNIEIIYDSPSGTYWYHPEKKILHHKITKVLNDQEMEEFLLLGTKFLKEKGVSKWLSDDQLKMTITKEFMTWGAAEWFPPTVAAGWKYWAIVRSGSVIGQLEQEKVSKECRALGIESRFFDNPEDALKWLESV
jgi:hypothetical protein